MLSNETDSFKLEINTKCWRKSTGQATSLENIGTRCFRSEPIFRMIVGKGGGGKESWERGGQDRDWPVIGEHNARGSFDRHIVGQRPAMKRQVCARKDKEL